MTYQCGPLILLLCCLLMSAGCDKFNLHNKNEYGVISEATLTCQKGQFLAEILLSLLAHPGVCLPMHNKSEKSVQCCQQKVTFVLSP
jgi:hypothetical protein